MEGLIGGLLTFVMKHPSYGLFINVLELMVLLTISKFLIWPIKDKQIDTEGMLFKHIEASVIVAQDVSNMKDSINEMKGLLAALNINNKGIR